MTTAFLIWLIASSLLAAFYVYIIGKYMRGWKGMPVWEVPAGFQPVTKVSVLIPARDEAANIIACLSSIANQSFPKHLFEVIVLDDHSTDNTAALVMAFSQKHPAFKLIKLADHILPAETQSFKKKAIETGVRFSAGDLIVTTDADCEVQPNWLMLLVSFFEKQRLEFIAAPVNFHREKTIFERFQSLDFLGMMCATAAGIHLRMNNMCNGANLAYAKAAFAEVNGFEGIDHLATGDDILLMQKIAARHPDKIGFLKNNNATVYTAAKPTIASFVSQRIRWASKSTDYKEWTVTFILGMVFFYCWSIVISLAMVPWWGEKALFLFLGLLAVKALADYFFLSIMARFFEKSELMKSYVPSQFLHIIYIVAVGVLGNVVKRYEWKGRRVR
ncbi:MAG: glycosyltransferase [Saprospiraceae bacterium]|nr:MAG: glycosyltransferase [Saprospiraceae bacterium]